MVTPLIISAPRPGNQIPADYAPFLERVFDNPTEDSYSVEAVEGRIPAFLRGTYYINGPGLFSRGDMKYLHWLDGDGMVCALRFTDRNVHFTNRYVRTPKFVEEEAAGRFLFRAFGTAFPGDRLCRGLALESPANVSVYRHQGRLLAFGEQSLPWELDPLTLESSGRFTFGSALHEFTPFSAHPKFDPTTLEMFNFGVFFSKRAPKLCLYRFDRDLRLLMRTTHPLELPFTIHDFGLSSRYCVFYLAPYVLDLDKLTREGSDMIRALRWESSHASRLLILERNSGRFVSSIELPTHYCLHMVNCFEVDDRLYIDLIELERPVYPEYHPLPDVFRDAPSGSPVRLVTDPEKGGLISREEIDYRLAPDFPSIDPERISRPYTDFWLLGISNAGRPGRKFFDQLARMNWDKAAAEDVFHAPSGTYLGGEPIFVSDSRSGGGAVISQEFDANRNQSSFLIFDAFCVRQGPIAKLRLERPIPVGFHASWSPATIPAA